VDNVVMNIGHYFFFLADFLVKPLRFGALDGLPALAAAFLAVSKAIAMAWILGRPDAISVAMFFPMLFLLYPFFNIDIYRFGPRRFMGPL